MNSHRGRTRGIPVERAIGPGRLPQDKFGRDLARRLKTAIREVAV